MKPEELVPERATCEALKAAGFPQGTLLHWAREKMYNDSQFRVLYGLGKSWDWVTIAAPTLGEILEQIRTGATVQVWRDAGGQTQACAWSEVRVAECEQARHTNPAEAAALLWLKMNAKEGA